MRLPLVSQTLDYTCGAACFESMFRFFKGTSPGEMFFADQLGTLALGYTQPERIVELALSYGFQCSLKEGATLNDLVQAVAKGEVVFVTWWDEDAGHYSLVESIDLTSIVLMDPWSARELKQNRIAIDFFLIQWKERGQKMIHVSLP